MEGAEQKVRLQMGDEVHNEEKPQAVEGAVSRRGLLEKGAMLAAVSAVPLGAGAAPQDADRDVERRQGHDAQAHELVSSTSRAVTRPGTR